MLEIQQEPQQLLLAKIVYKLIKLYVPVCVSECV